MIDLYNLDLLWFIKYYKIKTKIIVEIHRVMFRIAIESVRTFIMNISVCLRIILFSLEKCL